MVGEDSRCNVEISYEIAGIILGRRFQKGLKGWQA